MSLVYLTDVLKNANIDENRVMLLRHSLSDKEFKTCYDKGMVLEYTRCQAQNFSEDHDIWMVFISYKGTLAKLYGCFRKTGSVPRTRYVKPNGFPFDNWFEGKDSYFTLEPVEIMNEYNDRLVIDWGKSMKFYHRGIIQKPVVSIESIVKKPFPGFDKLVIPFDELKNVVDKFDTYYSEWRTTLSSVYAVYLITDMGSGKQYVGSATGNGGLLGRWREYVETGGHGNNKGLIEHLQQHPKRCSELQFSVLQVFTKSSDKVVLDAENDWKDKLQSRRFGFNYPELQE